MLAKELQALGAATVIAGNMRVDFYPKEAVQLDAPVRAPLLEETPSTKRGQIRAQLQAEGSNLYGSA